MKYGEVTLNPQPRSKVYKDVKSFDLQVYPRLNQADSHLMNLEPSIVMCNLVIRNWTHYIALKLLDRAHEELDLFVDMSEKDSHKYKRVVLELGEIKEIKPLVWIVPARFTCLDPYLYNATTGEVVY